MPDSLQQTRAAGSGVRSASLRAQRQMRYFIPPRNTPAKPVSLTQPSPARPRRYSIRLGRPSCGGRTSAYLTLSAHGLRRSLTSIFRQGKSDQRQPAKLANFALAAEVLSCWAHAFQRPSASITASAGRYRRITAAHCNLYVIDIAYQATGAKRWTQDYPRADHSRKAVTQIR